MFLLVTVDHRISHFALVALSFKPTLPPEHGAVMGRDGHAAAFRPPGPYFQICVGMREGMFPSSHSG